MPDRHKLYEKMSDLEKKSLVNTFIKSIEIYPDQSRKNGCPIKAVHFRFPVAYNGEVVYTICPPLETTDETAVQLINQNAIAKHHVQIEVDAEEYYKIKDAKTDSVKGTDDFGCI